MTKRYQWSREDNDDRDDRPSRSQKKRDSTALQRLGEELAALGPGQIADMPISADLKEALLTWQKLPSHEGRRRQMQFIGRLMREEDDVDAIRNALARIKLGSTEETIRFKRAEQLRDVLLQAKPESGELEKALAAFPEETRDELRDLAARARDEQAGGRPPHASRALFRKVRDLL